MIDVLFGLAKPLIHRLDAETAHRLAVTALAAAPLRKAAPDPAGLASEVFGLAFPNPLGLAAGFDKHGEAIDGALALGFGFVEIGGVTPLPQPGNPRPRVFRLPEDAAVINRYGLNSEGMEALAGRLAARRGRGGIVGVNLGANKDSQDRGADYATLARRLAPLADFLTVNVSSPNTPGLRDLQAEAALDDLIARTLAARDEACADTGALSSEVGTGSREDNTTKQRAGAHPRFGETRTGARRTAVLLKIAPDLSLDELDAIVAVARRRGIDGLVVANTTVARPASLRSAARVETGGLSGKPLFAPSTRLLAQARVRVEGALPLIGVGGIDSPQAALAKIRAGAALIQLYTALVYQGPELIGAIKRELAAAAAAAGGIGALVGADAEAMAHEDGG